MTLSSPVFFVFLAAVLLVLGVSRSSRFNRTFILVASWVFYASWDWRFVVLLLAVTGSAYVAGAAMPAVADDRRRAVMIAGVAFNLVVLGVFKYAGFFTESAAALAKLLGFGLSTIQLALPVAISFMTFQAIAYIVDVFRGDMEPATATEVAMLIAFFPHLLAGPILRPTEFIGQLRGEICLRQGETNAGLQQFVAGLAMKVLIADRLAVFVDPVMSRPGIYDDLTLWLALFAYAIQIYTDFAGYSAMAIGSARMMGLHIPPNFAAPYASLDITEFWRRWHISLSTWLRQYLYYPLGGNRKGLRRQVINLMIVMLLAGLWHGASWNFVLWGGLHGAGLAAHKLWVGRKRWRSAVPRPLAAAIAWAATWLYVSIAWLFFRVVDMPMAFSMLERMLRVGDSGGVRWVATSALMFIPTVLIASIVYVRRPVDLRPLDLGSFRGAFAATFVIIALALFWPTVSTPFIYLQF